METNFVFVNQMDMCVYSNYLFLLTMLDLSFISAEYSCCMCSVTGIPTKQAICFTRVLSIRTSMALFIDWCSSGERNHLFVGHSKMSNLAESFGRFSQFTLSLMAIAWTRSRWVFELSFVLCLFFRSMFRLSKIIW